MRSDLKRGLKSFAAGLSAIGILLAGCGLLTVERTSFPDEVIGTDGTVITRAEIVAILDNEDLSDDDRASAFRSLGIEDEKLIEVLLDL